MKKTILTFLIPCLLSCFCFTASAQVAPNPLDSTSLQGQYQTMLRRSKTQLGYKLINPYRLTMLWKSVSDSLRKEKSKSRELQKKFNSQASLLNSQKNELSAREQDLARSQSLVDEVSLLGISVNKTTYNATVWGIIVVLVLALVLVVYRSGSYRREARYRIKLFEELTGEFQSYKAKSNEKEKKLARELQDERNKLDELLKK